MPRRKRTLAATPSAQQLKQTTLISFAESSSAPSSPLQKRAIPSKVQAERKRKRAPPLGIVRDESSDQDNDSDLGAISFEPKIVNVTDEDEICVSLPKKRRTRVPRRVGSPVVETVATATEEPEQEEEEVIRPSRKGKWTKRAIYDSGPEELRPQKRKLVKGVRPPTPDEGADILDGVDKDSKHLIIPHLPQCATLFRNSQHAFAYPWQDCLPEEPREAQ
jgi:hypothetical protein